jgi:hypothetical protein
MLAAQFTIGGSKGVFFDSSVVLAAVNKATIKALSKAGAFVRRSAQTSIRYGKKVSAPGKPPTGYRAQGFRRYAKTKSGFAIRATSPLRELIFFAYDAAGESVVVGPVEYREAKQRKWKAPAVLEAGGSVSAQTASGSRTKRYRPRPFMGPALGKEIPKFLPLFKNSITG